MDPFVSTIVKQPIALGLAAGFVVGLGYFLVQCSKLQHAMSLNMLPGQLS